MRSSFAIAIVAMGLGLLFACGGAAKPAETSAGAASASAAPMESSSAASPAETMTPKGAEPEVQPTPKP
jgi:hypothetical protein